MHRLIDIYVRFLRYSVGVYLRATGDLTGGSSALQTNIIFAKKLSAHSRAAPPLFRRNTLWGFCHVPCSDAHTLNSETRGDALVGHL